MFKEFFIKEIGTALQRPMLYIFIFMMTLFGALMVIFGETIGSTGNEYARWFKIDPTISYSKNG